MEISESLCFRDTDIQICLVPGVTEVMSCEGDKLCSVLRVQHGSG